MKAGAVRQSRGVPAACWLGLALVFCLAAAGYSQGAGEGSHYSSMRSFRVKRLNHGKPLVHIDDYARLGITNEADNIQGPSVMRVPAWIPASRRAHPEAVYYMYFGHHRGSYIRMAWARRIEGPWTLHRMGPDVPPGERGVLDLGDRDVPIGNGIVLTQKRRAVISAPEVLVDDEERRIVLYVQAHKNIEVDGTRVKTPGGLVATSPYGLDFNPGAHTGYGIEPVILGPDYVSTFVFDDELYGVGNGGVIDRAPSAAAPWTPPPGWDFTRNLWQRVGYQGLQAVLSRNLDGVEKSVLRIRHADVVERQEGGRPVLWIFYTFRGLYEVEGEIVPEQVLFSRLHPSPTKSDWSMNWPPEQVLWAQPGWECGEFEPKPSLAGSALDDVNEIRDPHVFVEDGDTVYLFYCGCSEDGIGVAELDLQTDGVHEYDATDSSRRAMSDRDGSRGIEHE